jgi:peptidoglycan/xylan/chitin deacetylase (PgdA/CDA1 family)
VATHLLTLSFDDGFAKSFATVAGIHEEFDLKAQMNIVASLCRPGNVRHDRYQNVPTGDWTLWNGLAARGHEIGPHSWSHLDHTKIPFADARQEIDRCLDAFATNLRGFTPAKAVYAMPYNASNLEVESYLETKVRAYRMGGVALNPLPNPSMRRLTCASFGPGNAEADIDRNVERWLAADNGWLIYNTHGLDDEGWGPITPDYLRRLYARLKPLSHVRIVTFGQAYAL